MLKVVSFSLWGAISKYTLGAIANARLAAELYPGWQARFYCAPSVPADILDSLRHCGAVVASMPEGPGSLGMFWRFLALADPQVSHAVMRDTDSRLTPRERAAVAEWEASGLAGHVMRDHPYHSQLVMGGMWGGRAEHFVDMRESIQAFSPSASYNQDQQFLASEVYPRLLSRGLLVHDEFYRYERDARPFPTPRRDWEYVGEAFDADGQRDEQWMALQALAKSPARRCRFALKRLLLRWRRRCAQHPAPGIG